MKDRVSTYPGRVILTPVSGQANTYDLVRADQPTEQGTPLNKANLLTDETAALFGLANVATINDVFNKIGIHVWKKTTFNWTLEQYTTSDYSNEHLGRAYSTSAASSYTQRYLCGTSYSFNSSTGVISLSDTSTVNMSRNDRGGIVGKYFRATYSATDSYTYSRIRDDSFNIGAIFKSTATGTSINGNYIDFSSASLTEYYPKKNIVSTEYVFSQDQNAYPSPSGSSGNITYEYLGSFGTDIYKKSKIEKIEFIGTGTTSFSFTASFIPSYFIMIGNPPEISAEGSISGNKGFLIGVIPKTIKQTDSTFNTGSAFAFNTGVLASNVYLYRFNVDLNGTTVTLTTSQSVSDTRINYTGYAYAVYCVGGV